MVSKERRILEEGEKRIIPAFKSLQVNSSGRSLRPFLLPSSPRLSSLFARVPRHEQRKTDYFRLHSLPLYSRERDRRGGGEREREAGRCRVNQEMKTVRSPRRGRKQCLSIEQPPRG